MWRLSLPTARWSARLPFEVDTSRPDLGISATDPVPETSDPKSRQPDSLFLGVDFFPNEVTSAPLGTTECYVRGCDLIATYDATGMQSLQPQIYWRVHPSDADGVLLAVELLVSLQTPLLGLAPQVQFTSRFENGQWWQTGNLRDWEPAPATGPLEGAVFLWRAAEEGPSYAILSIPGDTTRWRRNASQLCGQILCDHLEKGVIRRSRIQGLVLQRSDDQRTAAQAYEEFRSAAPPLTT